MDTNIKDIAEIRDDLEKTLRSHQLVTEYQDVVTELLRIRREGVEGLIAGGMRPAEVARHLNISRQAVAKLVKAGPAPERAFLGTGPLTIAVGEKREAAKEHGKAGAAVAAEDLAAFHILAGLARELKLDATYETVRPPGMINVNRDNLVVICGPRLSPMISQILDSDQHLRFAKDSQGWFLRDLTTGHTYRSPMDQDVHADYAYLGRLPRLDGRGTFLYIAGVHAIGATGVTHWLTQNLADIYGELGKRRFSTLIRCEFEPDSLAITSSERVTPYYHRGGQS